MTTTPPPQDSNRAAYMPIAQMTDKEKRLIRAYLQCGRFDKAADACGVHPETVSRTWDRWRMSLLNAVNW